MHKKEKFKGQPSGFMGECIFSLNSHNFDNFHSIEKNQKSQSKAMFTLYRIGFCSISKVAPSVNRELTFCCGAEIVTKCSQCEQEPYLSYNLQGSLLI